jgi:hypothetical protein
VFTTYGDVTGLTICSTAHCRVRPDIGHYGHGAIGLPPRMSPAQPFSRDAQKSSITPVVCVCPPVSGFERLQESTVNGCGPLSCQPPRGRPVPCHRLHIRSSMAAYRHRRQWPGLHSSRCVTHVSPSAMFLTCLLNIAVFLQLGDMGVVVWILAMSFHTLIHVCFSRRPPAWVGPAVLFVGWAIVILLPILGSLVIADRGDP